ncbi:hypothetical protein JCM19000A_32730 [Silvimonas sp. JCM 19000]
MPEIEMTETELVAGLTEWHRRWVEEPDRFRSESEMFAEESATYGARAAPYLLGILQELREAA